MKKISLVCLLFIGFLNMSFALAAENSIEINHHHFAPDTLTIKKGEKITWVNRDQDPHTVFDSGSEKKFHSSALDTNDSYSFTFSAPGTYHFFCTMHLSLLIISVIYYRFLFFSEILEYVILRNYSF